MCSRLASCGSSIAERLYAARLHVTITKKPTSTAAHARLRGMSLISTAAAFAQMAIVSGRWRGSKESTFAREPTCREAGMLHVRVTFEPSCREAVRGFAWCLLECEAQRKPERPAVVQSVGDLAEVGGRQIGAGGVELRRVREVDGLGPEPLT